MKLKLYIITLVLIGFATSSFSDTIQLTSGEKVMGIIVEEYADRVVVSTFEGEKIVHRNNIKSLYYDQMEQNLIKLGDKYFGRGEYDKAYFYYEKATKVNPELKIARDKMNFIMGHLFRKKEEAKEDSVKRRQEFEEWTPDKPQTVEGADFKKELYEDIGFRISDKNNTIRVRSLRKGSPAEISGLKNNDILISVWGRLTGYMNEKDVATMLLKESGGEIKIVAERYILVNKKKPIIKNYRDIIGGRLDMLIEGLTVVELGELGAGKNAGLKEGDLIVAIDGKSTRYMPIKEAIDIIEDTKKDTVIFTIRREMTIWGR